MFSTLTRTPHHTGRLPLLTKLAYGAPALATTSLSFLVRWKESEIEI